MLDFNKAAVVIFFTCVNFSILTQVCNGQTPRLEFFQNTGCQDLVDTIYNYNSSLGSVDLIAHAANVGVFGLWQYQEEAFPMTQSTWKYGFSPSKDTECMPRYEPDSIYTRVTRYGSANLRDAALSVFTDNLFVGIQYSLIGNSSSAELILPRTMKMQSWYISGNHNYTVCEKTSFADCQCLRPNATSLNYDELGAWGMSYNWRARLVVGAIRYGCEDGSGAGNMQTQLPSILSIAVVILLKFVVQ